MPIERKTSISYLLPTTEVGMVPDSLGLAGKILGVLEWTPKGSYTGVAEIIGGSE